MERKLNIFIFFVIFSTLIFLVLFFSFLIFFFGRKSNKFEGNMDSYFISQFNVLSNETTFGLVHLSSRILKYDEFITFRSKNNELYSVISSKFSNEEFECSGTCFCNDKSSSDRRTVSILSKSLYFIISAFSLSLAVKIATDFFAEECFNSLKNTCSDDNIESEINFCKSSKFGKRKLEEEEYDLPFLSISEKTETTEKESVKIEELEIEGFEREFHCEGYCRPNGHLKHETSKRESEKINCRKYTRQGIVTIFEKKKLGYLYDDNYDSHKKAKIRFQKEYLSSFCRFVSKFEYEYIYTSPRGKKSARWKTVDLCVGSSTPIRYANICCSLLDPFTGMEGKREKHKFDFKSCNL